MLDKSASVWQYEVCGKTSPVTCFASRFRRFADFYIPQCQAKGAFGERLWKDQRCAVQRRWVHRVWIKIGSPQSWAAFDGFIMFYEFNAETRTWNDEHVWLHGVSLYLSLGSGLSLASGWNLCCAAISCMTSHRSFLFVVDCYVQFTCLSMWWHGEQMLWNDF